MSSDTEDSRRVLTSNGSVNYSCRFAFYDRHHGVSTGVYDSLNVGSLTGDSEEHVRRNRELVREWSGTRYLAASKQVHGDRVYLIEDIPESDVQVDGYDALITRRPDIGLMIQHADCQAVLLYDPDHGAVGAVHNGWRGSVVNILARTVEAMGIHFSTDPARLQAVISPSLGPCCAEFVNHRSELPAEFGPFMVRENYFDFWQISRWQLMMCGLVETGIRLPSVCTSCSEDYFSYRRACRQSGGITGRNCSVIGLMPDDNGR